MTRHQKFSHGDIVLVRKNLPWFEFVAKDGSTQTVYKTGHGERAQVVGSYKDQFDGGRREASIYTLRFKRHGKISWYEEKDLTLIEKAPRMPKL